MSGLRGLIPADAGQAARGILATNGLAPSGDDGERRRLWATPLYGIAEAHPFLRGLNAVDPLFDKLCVDLGFCLSREKIDELSARVEWTSEELADAVFIAEGLDPERGDRDLWRQVRDLIQAFASDA